MKKSFLCFFSGDDGVINKVDLNLPIFQDNKESISLLDSLGLFEVVLKRLLDVPYENPQNFIAYLERKDAISQLSTEDIYTEIEKFFFKKNLNIFIVTDSPNLWHFYLKNSDSEAFLYLQKIEEVANRGEYLKELQATLLEIC